MIALLDGDILVYRIGFAAENVEWPICRSRLDEFLETLLVFQLEVDDYKGWLTDGANNFRNALAVTVPYKGQRKGTKPKHYEAIRDYLVSKWEFLIEYEQEADDAIGIAATDVGDGSIIVTIDKDLDNIPGWHYNSVTKRKYYVTPYEATVNFYRQILTGDVVDNVKGLRGIGPVKADRILKLGGRPCSEAEYYARVVEAYDGDRTRVDENGKLLWIRTKPGEIWQPPVSEILGREVPIVKESNDTTVRKSKRKKVAAVS